MSRIAGMLTDFLLPQPCFMCSEVCAGGPLCAACRSALPVLRGRAVCAVRCRCRIQASAGLACPGRPAFDASRSAFLYRFPVSDMILRLKYHGDLYLAGQLGRMLASFASLEGIDAIVPIPLNRARLRQRGFNQAIELARPLARRTGLPLIVDAAVQNGYGSAGRAGSRRPPAKPQGAFRCVRPLRGVSVLVVDDVMTTGATLDEFARTPQDGGRFPGRESGSREDTVRTLNPDSPARRMPPHVSCHPLSARDSPIRAMRSDCAPIPGRICTSSSPLGSVSTIGISPVPASTTTTLPGSRSTRTGRRAGRPR